MERTKSFFAMLRKLRLNGSNFFKMLSEKRLNRNENQVPTMKTLIKSPPKNRNHLLASLREQQIFISHEERAQRAVRHFFCIGSETPGSMRAHLKSSAVSRFIVPFQMILLISLVTWVHLTLSALTHTHSWCSGDREDQSDYWQCHRLLELRQWRVGPTVNHSQHRAAPNANMLPTPSISK